MADKTKVGSAAVYLFPSMDGFAAEIDRELSKCASSAGSEFAKSLEPGVSLGAKKSESALSELAAEARDQAGYMGMAFEESGKRLARAVSDTSAFSKLTSAAEKVAGSVSAAFAPVQKSVSSKLSGVSDAVTSGLSKAESAGKSVMSKAADAIPQPLKSVASTAKAVLSPVSSTAAGAVKDLAPKLKAAASKAADGFGSGLKKIPGAVKSAMGTAAKAAGAGAAAVAAAITASVAKAAETSTYMSRLSASAEQNSVSAQAMSDTYKGLVGVLGETDRSVETAGNMFALCGDNQAALQKLTTSLTGAYSQFGDGLPIEGLAEAANETSKCGIVTGSFADALNWVSASSDQWSAAMGGNKAAADAFSDAVVQGMSKEDAFNAALAACSDEGERQQLVLSAMNALYGEAGQEYEDANRNLIEFNKSQDALGQAVAGIGQKFMPAVTLVQDGAAKVLDALGGMIPDIDVAKVTEPLSNIGSAAMAAVAGGGTAGISEAVSSLVSQVMGSMTSAVQQASAAIPSVMQSVLPAAVAGLSSLVSSVLTQLPQLIMSFIGLAVQGVSSFVQTLAAQLPTVLPVLVQAAIQAATSLVNSVLTDLPGHLGSLVNAALALFQGIVDSIPMVIPAVVSGIGDLVRSVLSNLPSFLGSMVSAAVTLFRGIATSIPKVVPAVLDGIASLLGEVFSAVTSFDLAGAGRDLIQGLINGISGMAGAVVDAIGGVVGGAIDWAKGMLGISSPSKLFRSFGEYTMEGYEIGVERSAEPAVASVREAMGEVASVQAPAAAPAAYQDGPGDAYSEKVYKVLCAILDAIPRGMTRREFDRAVANALA